MLGKMGKKKRAVVFYTEHHTKLMEEYMSRHIHDPKVRWLECMSGSNALDYQLIGVLSYLVAKHPGDLFYIYSDDGDYKKAINFWKSRGISISQKNTNGLHSKEDKKKKKKKKKKKQDKQDKKEVQQDKAVQQQDKTKDTVTASIAGTPSHKKIKEEQYIERIAQSVKVSDLSLWHRILTAIYGQQKGRDLYLEFKTDAQLKEKLVKCYNQDKKSRGTNLLAIALEVNGMDATKATEAYNIINSNKDLNSIKNAFDKKLGKDVQQTYYSVLKPYFNVLGKI